MPARSPRNGLPTRRGFSTRAVVRKSITAVATASGSRSVSARRAGGVTTSSYGSCCSVNGRGGGRRRCRGQRRRWHRRHRPRGCRPSASGSLRTAMVSSSSARSAGLITTAASRPLRVMMTRSCWCSTRSTTSDRWSRTERSGSAVVMDTIVAHRQPDVHALVPDPRSRPPHPDYPGGTSDRLRPLRSRRARAPRPAPADWPWLGRVPMQFAIPLLAQALIGTGPYVADKRSDFNRHPDRPIPVRRPPRRGPTILGLPR